MSSWSSSSTFFRFLRLAEWFWRTSSGRTPNLRLNLRSSVASPLLVRASLRSTSHSTPVRFSSSVEPLSARCVVMSGFSGHGFKFGPLLGRAVAAALGDPARMAALPGWAAGGHDEIRFPQRSQEDVSA